MTSTLGWANSRSCRMRSARKRVAAVHDGDPGGEIGQEQRFLDSGVAAADHDDFLVAVEEAVAGGAGRDAEAAEFLLGGKIEPLGLSAGGDDQRLGKIDLAGFAFEPERTCRQVDLGDMVIDDAGADMLGLLLHLLHEPGALDDIGEAGIILDIGGDGQLAAGLDALDHDRLQHGARGIDCSRVSGGAGTDDDDAFVVDAHGALQPAGVRRNMSASRIRLLTILSKLCALRKAQVVTFPDLIDLENE